MAKRGTLDHPKNKRLARALNTFHGVTLGLLETIWHQAAQFHSNGVMSRLDIEDAMDAGGWLAMFQIEQVIAQLTSEKHKWLDVLPDGNFYIHDWHLHCDDSTHAKLYRSLTRFGNGTNPKAAKVYGDERKELELKWSKLQPWIPAGYPPGPLPCPSLPSLAKPSPALTPSPCVDLKEESGGRIGEPPKTRKQKAASLATEYRFRIPGVRKQMLEELTPLFEEKLRVYGDDKYDFILEKIKGERDKSLAMFHFWKLCDMDGVSLLPPPPPAGKSPEQLRHEANLGRLAKMNGVEHAK